jgi:hypothetical protein
MAYIIIILYYLFINLAFEDYIGREGWKEKLGRLGRVAAGEAELLAGVGVARRKAWPAIEKVLLKFSIIMDSSVLTVLPSLSAVGSWEEVILFSMDFTVSENFLELVPHFPELLHIVGSIRCYCSPPLDVFVLVKGSQVWSVLRAISVLGSSFFKLGMLI